MYKENESNKTFTKKQKERSKKCREDYENNPKSCKHCNKKIIFEKRTNNFCNHSCAASYNNLGKRKHGKEPNNCKQCSKKLNHSKRVFCSVECLKLYNFLEIEAYIKETGKLPTNKYGGTAKAKKYLLKVKGHICEICNRTNWKGEPIPLIFDHIDGNSNNWLIDNCRLICPNCDHQLPTFGGKNRNKSNSPRSEKRKKRYKEQKENHKYGERVNY